MRLFIFNQGQLKYVIAKKVEIRLGDSLFKLFGDIIETIIKEKKLDKMLWTTLFQSMNAVTFNGANSVFFSETNDSDSDLWFSYKNKPFFSKRHLRFLPRSGYRLDRPDQKLSDHDRTKC